MSQVEVKIGNYSYSIACKDGQEEHLRAQAAKFNQRVTTLAQGIKREVDIKVMIITCLVMENEIEELKKDLQEAGARKQAEAQEIRPSCDLTEFVSTLEIVAQMLEKR